MWTMIAATAAYALVGMFLHPFLVVAASRIESAYEDVDLGFDPRQVATSIVAALWPLSIVAWAVLRARRIIRRRTPAKEVGK